MPALAVGREQAQKAIEWITSQPVQPDIVHFDLETVGLNAEHPFRLITNVGIACNEFLVGIDLTPLTPAEASPVWDWLKKQKLGGFNLKFDMAWPWGADVSPSMFGIDTAIMFRWLATESLASQPHSLDAAISTILGWPEEMYQKAWLKDKLVEHNISKNQMYKLATLEPEGYTSYCALDAEASFQLERVLLEEIDRHGFRDVWDDFNDRILPHKMYRNIQAQYAGIEVNREKCLEWIEKLQASAIELEGKILAHPDVSPIVDEYIKAKAADMYQLRINERRVWAKKQEKPWLDPSFTFLPVEDPSKLPRWMRERGGKWYKSEPILTISGGKKPYPKFNFSSPDDMKHLIYDNWLKDRWEIVYNEKWGKPSHLEVTLDGKTYELELTIKKAPPTGGDILKLFGEVGKMIEKYKMINKLLQDFLWKYYEASAYDGKIHPTLKINGAATGRASGG